MHVEERVGPHYDKAKMLEARQHTWHAIEKIAGWHTTGHARE